MNLADKTTDELIALAAGLLESWSGADELKDFSLTHKDSGWTCALTLQSSTHGQYVHCYLATRRASMRVALLDCLEKPARDGLLRKAVA